MDYIYNNMYFIYNSLDFIYCMCNMWILYTII